jgi:chitodextrinase
MFFRKASLVVGMLVLAITVGAATAAAVRDKARPTTPTNLRITGTTDTSISLAWNASTGNSGNFWYCVQRNSSGCFRVDPPQTTFTLTRLAPNQTHVFSVYAIDAAGNRSGNSNSVSYTTPPDTTPPSPAPELTATAVQPTRVSLTWTASVDNVSQVYYTLFLDGNAYFGGEIGVRQRTILDLSPSTTYTFKITASDAYGNSVDSNVLTVTTPAATDTQPPTVPQNLRLSPESQAPEIWLDWDQSTDDVDPQSEILYDVYINGVLDHAALGRGDTITYCVAPGPNTIAVQAVDSTGNASALSNQIIFDC